MGSACLPCLVRVLSLAVSLQGCVLCIVFQHCYNSNGKWAEGLSGQNRSRCQTFSYDYLAVLVPGKCYLNTALHEEWREERNKGETGKGPPRALHSLACDLGDTFVLQVMPAGFVLVCWPPRGAPEKPNAFLFKTLKLKMFRETSLLWETQSRCVAGL